jgi:hypothetical protein
MIMIIIRIMIIIIIMMIIIITIIMIIIIIIITQKNAYWYDSVLVSKIEAVTEILTIIDPVVLG